MHSSPKWNVIPNANYDKIHIDSYANLHLYMLSSYCEVIEIFIVSISRLNG